MNKLSVPGAEAVRRLSRRVSPAIPKVKAGFKTLYLQCNPTKIATALPKLRGISSMPRPHLPTMPKLGQLRLARVLAMPRIKLPPMPKVPALRLNEMRLSASRAIRRHLNLVQECERGAFYAGHLIGRVNGIRGTARDANLFVTTASLPEAVLLEPMLRTLAARHPDRELHVWAYPEVCELYAAAPFVAQLRALKVASRNGYSLSQQIGNIFGTAAALGRREYSAVLCDPRSDAVLAHAFSRGARTKSLWVLDRSGPEREETRGPARVIRYLRFDGSAADLLGAFAQVAAEWRGNAVGESPVVYPSDSAAQLAHSRSRGWRSEAQSIGATALVAVCPCAQPADVAIGLGLWAQVVRELWSKHKALPILFSEGADVAAIEQVSSLLEEVPHIRLTGSDDVLERASLLDRVDAVIAAAGACAQIAMAQGIPTVIAGSEYRRRLFAWNDRRTPYLLADVPNRLTANDVLRAYGRLIKPRGIRVAV